MDTSRVPVAVKSGAYDVLIGESLLREVRHFCDTEKPTSVILLTDENVGELYADHFRKEVCEADSVVVPAGEGSKSIAEIERIYDKIFALGKVDRQTLLVAMGGGVVGDLTGFVAATLMRGVRYVQLPTSLLAMVDSSVGGKTGINHPTGKNLIGAFHQPAAVFCDLTFLNSLPDREYRSALAEIVKTAAIGDADLLEFLEKHRNEILSRDSSTLQRTVEACVRFKARVVAEDEREASGKRATLNFGHTLAHVLETEFPGRYLHGEAVSIGMVAALRLSFARARLGQEAVVRVRNLLARFELPVDTPDDLDPQTMLKVMASDKKRNGDTVGFVVISEIGQAGTLPCHLDAELADMLIGNPNA